MAACREALLTLRSLLDAALHGLGQTPAESPAKRIRIEQRSNPAGDQGPKRREAIRPAKRM